MSEAHLISDEEYVRMHRFPNNSGSLERVPSDEEMRGLNDTLLAVVKEGGFRPLTGAEEASKKHTLDEAEWMAQPGTPADLEPSVILSFQELADRLVANGGPDIRFLLAMDGDNHDPYSVDEAFQILCKVSEIVSTAHPDADAEDHLADLVDMVDGRLSLVMSADAVRAAGFHIDSDQQWRGSVRDSRSGDQERGGP